MPTTHPRVLPVAARKEKERTKARERRNNLFI
jgi:hypothetical protein